MKDIVKRVQANPESIGLELSKLYIKKKENDGVERKISGQELEKMFKLGVAQFKTPPVFHISAVDEENAVVTKKELFLSNTFKVKLGILNDDQTIPAKEEIGYDFEDELEKAYYHQVHNYLHIDSDKYGKRFSPVETYLNYYKLIWHPRLGPFCPTDSNLMVAEDEVGDKVLKVVPPKNNRDEIVETGAILDFDKVPIDYHHTQSLIHWLQCRGYTITQTLAKNRRSLRRIVRCAHDLNIQPRKYDPESGNEGTHHYTSDEDLYVAPGTSIDWSDNDDTILTLIMKVKQLDDNYNSL